MTRIFNQRPHVWSILIACVAGFLAGEVLATAALAILVALNHYPGGVNHLARVTSQPWWASAAGVLGLWTGMAFAIGYAQRSGGLTWLRGAFTWRWTDVGYVGVGVGCQLLVDAAYAPFHFKGMGAPVRHLFGAAHGWTFILMILLTALGAPIVEECFFRATLYRALASDFDARWGRRGRWLAMGLSGLLFGAAHGELLQLAGLTFLGVVLAFIVQRTQRLLPSIVTHVSFNAVTLVAVTLQRTHH